MRCRVVRRLIVAFQDEELSPGEATQVAEHLTTCDDCRKRDAHLRAVTPAPLKLVRPSVDPDWSKLDAALNEAWTRPAPPRPVFVAPRPMALAFYGLAVGALLAWGLSNAMRVQSLEMELAAATAAPPIETLFPAAAMQPASYKPGAPDGKPH